MEDLAEEFGGSIVLLLLGSGLIGIFVRVLTWVSSY